MIVERFPFYIVPVVAEQLQKLLPYNGRFEADRSFWGQRVVLANTPTTNTALNGLARRTPGEVAPISQLVSTCIGLSLGFGIFQLINMCN